MIFWSFIVDVKNAVGPLLVTCIGVGILIGRLVAAEARESRQYTRERKAA